MNVNDRVTFDVRGTKGEVLETLTGRIVRFFKNGKAEVRVMNRWATAMKNYNAPIKELRPAAE